VTLDATLSQAPPEAGTGSLAGEGDLHRKLVWLTLFRIVTITVLLGGTAFVNWQFGARANEAVAPLYAVVAVTYAASIALALLLRARNPALDRITAGAQIALDVGLSVAVVAITGVTESVFVFMFLLAIVNGAILLHRAGAVIALGAALAAYGLTILWLHPAPALIRGTLFAHASAFVATAALASFLAEQLRRTGERLAVSEHDLATVTALHESIVQSVTSGLVTMDPAGRVTFMNRAAEQISGLAFAQAAGQPGARWFPSFARGGRDEIEWVTPAGVRRLLGYTGFDLHGRGGKRSGTAVIFQDLTELRAMQEAVDRSKRLADLGTVAAGLAHELRNPLASISGCVELLGGAEGLSAEDQRIMGIVLRETSRLDQLLTRFLEFTRPAPPQRREADLAALLGDTLDVFAADPAAAGLRIERALASAPVSCDPDQLRQVTWNLVANAGHACRSANRSGTVRVACAPSPGGGATLSVEDDGPGIPAAELSRIFTPFFTTKAGGTGLGLAVVQRIVDAHGGSVEVDSGPGRGARFTIRLPGPRTDRQPAEAGLGT
jgi:two-component system sensor histidine kinase PilS (NtrC family)